MNSPENMQFWQIAQPLIALIQTHSRTRTKIPGSQDTYTYKYSYKRTVHFDLYSDTVSTKHTHTPTHTYTHTQSLAHAHSRITSYPYINASTTSLSSLERRHAMLLLNAHLERHLARPALPPVCPGASNVALRHSPICQPHRFPCCPLTRRKHLLCSPLSLVNTVRVDDWVTGRAALCSPASLLTDHRRLCILSHMTVR